MAKSRKRSDSSVPTPSPEGANGNGQPRSDRERVAKRAYELYLSRGGSHGSDWDDWLAAERELINGPSGEQERGEGEDR